jgi:hypothetical protein
MLFIYLACFPKFDISIAVMVPWYLCWYELVNVPTAGVWSTARHAIHLQFDSANALEIHISIMLFLILRHAFYIPHSERDYVI